MWCQFTYRLSVELKFHDVRMNPLQREAAASNILQATMLTTLLPVVLVCGWLLLSAEGFRSMARLRHNGLRMADDDYHTLVLIRHGESTWNEENKFTGWYDCPLSEKGKLEAQSAGKLLADNEFKFDMAYSSYLQRAIRTCWYCLEETGQMHIPLIKAWNLNERHYGALQGLDKKETGAPLIIFPYIPSQNTQFHQVSVSNHLLYVFFPAPNLPFLHILLSQIIYPFYPTGSVLHNRIFR